jgi:hypothetical protein
MAFTTALITAPHLRRESVIDEERWNKKIVHWFEEALLAMRTHLSIDQAFSGMFLLVALTTARVAVPSEWEKRDEILRCNNLSWSRDQLHSGTLGGARPPSVSFSIILIGFGRRLLLYWAFCRV